MKSLDVRNIVIFKHKNGESPGKFFHDLNGTLSLPTIKSWCKMIANDDAIDLSKLSGRPRTVRTNVAIQKIKNHLNRKKKPISKRKMANELNMSSKMVFNFTAIRKFCNRSFPKDIKKKESRLEIGFETTFEKLAQC